MILKRFVVTYEFEGSMPNLYAQRWARSKDELWDDDVIWVEEDKGRAHVWDGVGGNAFQCRQCGIQGVYDHGFGAGFIRVGKKVFNKEKLNCDPKYLLDNTSAQEKMLYKIRQEGFIK